MEKRKQKDKNYDSWSTIQDPPANRSCDLEPSFKIKVDKKNRKWPRSVFSADISRYFQLIESKSSIVFIDSEDNLYYSRVAYDRSTTDSDN